VLTKLVLYATPSGKHKLVEVPFSWRQGDALPMHTFELTFGSALEALQALAERGRKQQRVHVDRPERSPTGPEKPADAAAPPEDPYAAIIQLARQSQAEQAQP
jgi:hypothetical protein